MQVVYTYEVKISVKYAYAVIYINST